MPHTFKSGAALCLAVIALSGCWKESIPQALIPAPTVVLTADIPEPLLVLGVSRPITLSAKFSGDAASAGISIVGTLPAGVTAQFSNSDVRDVRPVTMTLLADATVRPGTFNFEVKAEETQLGNTIMSKVTITARVDTPFVLTASGTPQVTVGTSAGASIGVVRRNGFAGPVGMSVVPGTVPAGTVVAFTPASVSNSDNGATLRLDIPGNAQIKPYQVLIVGTYGASSDTTLFPLDVRAQPVPPDMTVLAAPGTVTVIPGASATYDLAFTRNAEASGLGNISLAVSGLPPGATHTFTPTVPNASSQLVVNTASGTSDGPYQLTVTATLGTIVKTTRVTLVVATPSLFKLLLAPAALTVARSASGQSTVTIERTGPVTAVAISATSPTGGVEVVANPASTTDATSVLTVTVDGTANPGTYPITVRGVSGAVTSTATLSLTIPAPPTSNVTIRLLTPTVSIATGSMTRIPIKLTRVGNAVGQLLELRSTGIPLGGNAWITPSFTTGDSATLHVLGGLVGKSSVVVSAALGAFPPSDVATINVTASTTPDFSIVPAPQTLNMSTGSPVQMGLEIGRTNGFTGPVSFVGTGDAAGQYTITFSLNSTTSNGIGMTVYASPNVPAGPHILTIRGTSGAIVREVTMTIVISSTPSYPEYPYYPGYPYGIRPPP